MRAWDAPASVTLPGQAALPRIFDTAAGEIVQVQEDKAASLYVCGITPYDATHMGHASTYVAFDLLHRAWLDAGRAGDVRAERDRCGRPAAGACDRDER